MRVGDGDVFVYGDGDVCFYDDDVYIFSLHTTTLSRNVVCVCVLSIFLVLINLYMERFFFKSDNVALPPS